MGTPSSLEAKALNLPVNEPVLMKNTEAFAEEWNVLFTMSSGTRKDVTSEERVRRRKSAALLATVALLDCCRRILLDHVCQQQAENWLNGTPLKLFGGYPAKDIFSADATATFFHCLPQKTQTNYDSLSRARETACTYSTI
ncbi:hypothetical protein T07_5906 [Trichinella nelsoni]|uniref:Uncharacterized protein n=1 Tax=Trichinella nelsoni TaxID=6336 RepID=A0A0V0S289_9BILA|nr:hypothetical protein T07_5906 [Trichinella nelsoni]